MLFTKFLIVESLLFFKELEPESGPEPEPVKKNLGAGGGQKRTGSATLPAPQHASQTYIVTF